MSENSPAAVVDHPNLADNITLHEEDLTEEAKREFGYHTKILDVFEQNRRIVLENDQISSLGRHLALKRLEQAHRTFKQVLNYAAANHELLSSSLPSFGPLIICGLPRTGSTLLYNLLACDPNCRAPLFVDMFIECAPPIPRSDVIGHERRMHLLMQHAAMRAKLVNRPIKHAGSHPNFPIEQDLLILEHVGIHLLVLAISPLHQSEVSRLFYDKMNKDCVYTYHELFLRMLNSVDKPDSHWLLKSPEHTFYLDALLQQYPHAALIITHRALDEVMPSFCRLFSTFDYCFDETNASGQQILKTRALEYIDKSVECVLKFRRQENGEHDQVRKTTFDVLYDDLMKDPISVVRRIYDHFGLHWSDQFEVAMQAWLHDNPQGKQGRNSYSLSDFDLTEDDINKRYAGYIDLFLRPTNDQESSPANTHS